MKNPALYLDEDINPGIAVALRSRGYDVISTRDADMLGSTDLQQLQYAIQNKRCFVTRNVKDFLALARQYQERNVFHFGIAVTRKISISELVFALSPVLNSYSSEELKNRVMWV